MLIVYLSASVRLCFFNNHRIKQTVSSLFIHSDSKDQREIFSGLDTDSLPALQHDPSSLHLDKYEDIRKTVYVDECQIRLHLVAMTHEQFMQHTKLDIIVINE